MHPECLTEREPSLPKKRTGFMRVTARLRAWWLLLDCYPMLVIARFEFRENIRNRWLLSFGAAILLLSNLIVYFAGDNPLQAAGSLMSLVLLIIPMFALVFGAVAFTESIPFLELLSAQPVSRRDLYLGKWLGLGSGLALSFVVGMGVGSAPRLGDGGLGGYLLLLGLGALLSMCFTAIAFFIGSLSSRKEIVLGLVMILWFFFFILYDLLVLGVVVMFGDYPLDVPMMILAILNPIDLARIMLTLQMELSAMMGYSGALFNKYLGGPGGVALGMFFMLLWTTLPLLAGLRLFRKRNL